MELAELSLAVPTTGKRVRDSGIIVDRVEDGKIVAHWTDWDALALAQQVGAIPAPSRAGRNALTKMNVGVKLCVEE